MGERKIVLVRHGRSAHGYAGWVDTAGFRRWREAYEAAGIDAKDIPPRELREAAASAFVVSSDVRRAVESAQALAPGAAVTTSPLLRELELVPPNLGSLRMPLFGWALAYGLRMLIHRDAHITPAERERAREAAHWLADLAEERGSVVAVTHHSFRTLAAETLEAEGWRRAEPRRRSTHWSAWGFTR